MGLLLPSLLAIHRYGQTRTVPCTWQRDPLHLLGALALSSSTIISHTRTLYTARGLSIARDRYFTLPTRALSYIVPKHPMQNLWHAIKPAFFAENVTSVSQDRRRGGPAALK